MNGSILPFGLVALPYPWHLSSDDSRREVTSRLPTGAEQRATALEATQACLDYLVDDFARHGYGVPDELPEQFYESWIFFERSFNERMPTLADVSLESIRQWLIDEVDPEVLLGTTWATPPPDLPDAIGRFWAPAKVGCINRQLLRWLTTAVKRYPDAIERRPFLNSLRSAAARLDWRGGQMVLGFVWDLGGNSQRNFFLEIEADLTVPQQTQGPGGQGAQGQGFGVRKPLAFAGLSRTCRWMRGRSGDAAHDQLFRPAGAAPGGAPVFLGDSSNASWRVDVRG